MTPSGVGSGSSPWRSSARGTRRRSFVATGRSSRHCAWVVGMFRHRWMLIRPSRRGAPVAGRRICRTPPARVRASIGSNTRLTSRMMCFGWVDGRSAMVARGGGGVAGGSCQTIYMPGQRVARGGPPSARSARLGRRPGVARWLGDAAPRAGRRVLKLGDGRRSSVPSPLGMGGAGAAATCSVGSNALPGRGCPSRTGLGFDPRWQRGLCVVGIGWHLSSGRAIVD